MELFSEKKLGSLTKYVSDVRCQTHCAMEIFYYFLTQDQGST